MIPKMTQQGPNILPEHWCTTCGIRLQQGDKARNISRWNYCSNCGSEIEWDKVVPVKWEPMDCDICGVPLLRALPGGHIQTQYGFIGTTTCSACMMEFCRTTNCLSCSRGNYPDCKYRHLKKQAMEVTDGA